MTLKLRQLVSTAMMVYWLDWLERRKVDRDYSATPYSMHFLIALNRYLPVSYVLNHFVGVNGTKYFPTIIPVSLPGALAIRHSSSHKILCRFLLAVRWCHHRLRRSNLTERYHLIGSLL